MKNSSLLILAAAVLAGSGVARANVLYSISPDLTGVPQLTEIDPVAQTVAQLRALGNGSVAFGGLTFDQGAGDFKTVGMDGFGGGAYYAAPFAAGPAAPVFNVPASGLGGLAYSGADNKVYGTVLDSFENSTLQTYSPSTFFALGVGFSGGLTFDSADNLLYGIASDSGGLGELYQINPATQIVTLIMRLGFGFYGGLAYDSGLNQFYAISDDDNGAAMLNRIDVGQLSLTPLFGVGNGYYQAALTEANALASIPEPGTLCSAGLVMAFLIVRAYRQRGKTHSRM